MVKESGKKKIIKLSHNLCVCVFVFMPENHVWERKMTETESKNVKRPELKKVVGAIAC